MDFHNIEDENHRLLEEIMDGQNNNNSSNNNSGNKNTHIKIENNFLSDPSFLNSSAYPQLNNNNFNNNDDDNNNSNNNNNERPHEFLQFTANINSFDIDNSNSTSNFNDSSIYQNTPAQQHEKLLYNNRINSISHSTNSANNRNYSSSFNKKKINETTPNNNNNNNNNNIPITISNNDNDDINSTSFLDDMFTRTHLNSVQNYQTHVNINHNQNHINHHHNIDNSVPNSFINDHTNDFHKHSISTSVISNEPLMASMEPHSFSEPAHTDFLFNHGADDAMFSYTDDISSSLSSSVTSDIATPSSFSFNPQQLESIVSSPGIGTNNTSNSLSASVRSPSASSARPGNYLSQSLRQPNLMSTTPKSRHASLANNINYLDPLSTSVPKSLSHLSTEEKLRRKRDFHNAVERRRRELIKQKIKELGNLVPPSLLCFDNKGKQVKPNKGIILNKTVEYIHFLLRVLESQENNKRQLLNKMDELDRIFSGLNINIDNNNNPMNVISHSNSESTLKDTSNDNSGKNSDNLMEQSIDDTKLGNHTDEKILDARARPQHDNAQISDDLKQFLSGDIAEAEDNAKLMFGSTDLNSDFKNAADYLLEFDS